MIIFASAFTLAGPISGFFAAQIFLLALSSRNWPSVVGTIRAADIHPSSPNGFRLDVGYEFVVKGQTFYGNGFRAAGGEYNSREEAADAMGNLHSGQRTNIYYNPADPGQSLLIPGVGFSECAFPCVSMLTFGVGILLFLWFGRVCKRDALGLAVRPEAPMPVVTPELEDNDLTITDRYLKTWDEFTRGNQKLVPALRDGRARFEGALLRKLNQNDCRGPSRLVFWLCVQVGGSIAVDSELGRAVAKLLGSDAHVLRTPKGKAVYFAGDVFFWWQKSKSAYESYPLLEDWLRRDFAQKTVLPMYRKAAERRV